MNMKILLGELMKNMNKKILKIILYISLAAGIGTATYIYFPSQKSRLSNQHLQVTKADNRPDEIKGDIVTLRLLNPKHYQAYFKMVDDPLVLKPLYFPKNITFSWIKEYLDENLELQTEGLTFIYVIFDNKDDKLIGSIEIREPNPSDPGQFGCWLNPAYWGGGRLQEAFQLISKEYFKLFPKKEKFNAHVEMWNLRSYFSLKKCGFKLTDTLHFKRQPSRYLLEYYNPKKNNPKSSKISSKEI